MIEAVLALFFTTVAGNIFFTDNPSTTVILARNGNVHNAIVIKNDLQNIIIDKPNNYVKLEENKQSQIKYMSQEDLDERFKNIIENTPQKPISYLLYFENGYTLTKDSENKLQEVLNTIKNRKSVNLTIIGHSDTLGDSKQNEILSLKRADFIKNLLISNNNLQLNSLSVESYGENDLLVPTKDEVKEPKNRRVEIFIK